MGKHGGGHKLSEEYNEKVRLLGKPVEEVVNELPVKTLLRIGKRVCSSDYAVYNYKKSIVMASISTKSY